jgi:hypothetical protein
MKCYIIYTCVLLFLCEKEKNISVLCTFCKNLQMCTYYKYFAALLLVNT